MLYSQLTGLKMSGIQGQRTAFVHALLSTLREGILFDQDDVFKAVGKRSDLKIHIVWVSWFTQVETDLITARALLTRLFRTR